MNESEAGMGQLTKKSNEKPILINIVEYLVKKKVNELIKEIDMCKCDLCRLNACAIALNHLKPHYVTTSRGALLGELNDVTANYIANIVVEVTKSLVHVKNNPHH